MKRTTATNSPASAGTQRWRRGILAGVFALSAVTSACFEAPGGDVTFACDPFAAPECPEGYTCQSDGCCHENGSDIEANAGACRLGGQEGTDGTDGTGGTGDTGG